MMAKVLGWLLLLAIAGGIIWLLIVIVPIVLPFLVGGLVVVAWVKNNQ